MSIRLRVTASFCFLFLVSGCAGPHRYYSDFVPAESLRVAQVFHLFARADFVSPSASEAYQAIRAAGIADSDLIDGSMTQVRIFCCGGLTKGSSAEYTNTLILYVPKPLKVEAGDFVEFRVGRLPEKDAGARLNTVTRVVAKQGDKPETCWWDPRNDKLWLRVAYCDWMAKEGWVKQGGTSPAWFKPAR
jgi:hypothetical protein